MPIAVVVDLDYVRRSEPGDAPLGDRRRVSNLSAIADWRLAERERGEAVDGVAVTFARTAATALLHREDGIDDDDFLIALAEALVLSRARDGDGRLEPPVQRRRATRSSHAIDHLFPGTAQPRRAGGRRQPVHLVPARATGCCRAHRRRACAATGCRARPPTSASRDEQFAEAVAHAPRTRPDRYTILEHLDLDEGEVRERVGALRRRLRSLSCARRRSRLDLRAQQRRALGGAALHAPLLAVPDAAAARARRSRRNARHVADDRRRRAGRARADAPGLLPGGRAPSLLIQLQLLLDCSDGELARWREQSSPVGIYLDRFGHYLTETLLPIALGIRADGGWDSIGGWTTLGLLTAVLVLLLKSETHLVPYALSRSQDGSPTEGAAGRGAPCRASSRRSALARRRSLAPHPRRQHCSTPQPMVWAPAGGSRLALAVFALVAVVGHLAAILASDRLK